MRRTAVLSRSKVLLLAAAVTLGVAVPAFGSVPAPAAEPAPRAGAAAGYATTHFGDGNLPAGCIVDRDEANPDNACHHLKVGLNALDSPQIDVAVLVPLSPTAERDMRIMRQSVEMWEGGIDHLARQMELDWLAEGVDFDVTTKLVPVDAAGLPTQAVDLVKPDIVVIATNPVGGIGIGINPTDFLGEVGFTDGRGAPCGSISNPFNMDRVARAARVRRPPRRARRHRGPALRRPRRPGLLLRQRRGRPGPRHDRLLLALRPGVARDRPLPDPRPRG
jgi:hypothetical protein